MQSRDLLLNTLIDMCRASESTLGQVKVMSQEGDAGISLVQNKNYPSRLEQVLRKPSQVMCCSRDSTERLITCKFFGKSYRKKNEDCVAWDKKCVRFGLDNHFAAFCPTPKPRSNVNILDN